MSGVVVPMMMMMLRVSFSFCFSVEIKLFARAGMFYYTVLLFYRARE